MNHLDKLEAQSVHILREAYREFKNICMLWSIGKDSTVLLWLARKAFFGHVPIPLVHVDTHFKIPEMIKYRDDLAFKWKLTMIYGENSKAILEKNTFPDGNVDRISCCQALKSEALKNTLSGEWDRYIMDLTTGKYIPDTNRERYTGVIVGVRADEEGSRSKERYFSPRDKENDWDVGDQPPEFWNQYKTDFAPGTHIRIHPLLDWTELNIWEYIERENIPITSLYFDRGSGKRYRSLGCYPCTTPVDSNAKNVSEIIEELKSGKFAHIAERSGRAQDKDDGGGLETLRRGGICNMNTREQMNIVIVGHVDHGKSTVIGRLLADTGSLPEGKLESVKEYCKKNSRPFEYAFLLDALKDEQAQGITIDTARCFFKTQNRDYIIIDAPGHIEFLKNMVTGASRAEAALLVIDAKEGIAENSKRHGHIVAMLGIKQVVVLVNKMDLVGFNQDVYNNIRGQFTEFLNKINIEPVEFIPISAFDGDNVADQSNHTIWYNGPTVLEQLDAFDNKKQNRELPLRMPVQDIYKFTGEGDDRRIVAGTILSGTIRKGDEVIFLPSKKKSTIKSIEEFNVIPRDTAYADEAIGVTLNTQIYIQPGELMVKANEKQPLVSSCFKVNIFWVGKGPLIKNKNYKLKIGTMKIGVKLLEISSIIDAAELNIDTFKDQVEKHDVAECIFETVKPIAFDSILDNDMTGRFVIVDNYEISGGGMILHSVSDNEHSLTEHIESREYLWEKGLISSAQRNIAYGHKSKFIVITSGNEGNEQIIQEVAKELESKLFKMNYKAYYLGIGSILQGLASDSAVDYRGRDEQIRQIGELARIITDSGQIFVTTVFNLDDYEAEKLKLLNQPHDILVINIGESPFHCFQPDASIPSEGSVEVVCDILKKQDIILEYYL